MLCFLEVVIDRAAWRLDATTTRRSGVASGRR
jgi:hypothetical protein